MVVSAIASTPHRFLLLPPNFWRSFTALSRCVFARIIMRTKYASLKGNTFSKLLVMTLKNCGSL